MLKIVICLFVVASGVSGATIGRVANATVTEKPFIPVLRFETDKNPDGSFHFAYEGADQSFRQESGHLENAGTEDETLEVSGSYRYIDADGQEIEVHYTAGKNGFVPIGTNIPSEISLLAKAAADLPNTSYEEEQELKLKNRRARAQTDEKKEAAENLPKAAESQIIPVKILVEEKPAKVEKLEKTEEKVEKVETKSA